MFNFKNKAKTYFLGAALTLFSVTPIFAQDAGSTKSTAAGTVINERKPTKHQTNDKFTNDFMKKVYGLRGNTNVPNTNRITADDFENKYWSISEDDMLAKYYVDNLDDKDVQKGAWEYLNKHLYSTSGSNIVLDDKFNPGEFRLIDGEYWLSTLQVGDGNGYFKKEKDHSETTTWSNIGDQMGRTIDESRAIVKVNENVIDDAIKTYLFPSGRLFDHVAADDASKEGTMDQKLNGPVAVYEYNWRTGDVGSKVTVLNKSSPGHYKWERGSSGWLPVEGLFYITGTDLDELNDYLTHLDQNYDDLAYVMNLLDDMTNKYEDMKDWALTFQQMYTQEYEKHERTKANWRAGFQGYVGFPLDKNSDSKPMYSVEAFTTMPFIANNSIKFGMGYTFMPNSSMTLPSKVTNYHEERSGNPIFGETIGFTQEEKGGPTDVTQHRIYGLLGVHLGNDWFVTGRGGVRRLEFDENTFTTTGFKNDAGDEWDVNRTLATKSKLNENQPFAGITIDKLFGPVGISVGGDYNFTTSTGTGQMGVIVDLGYLTK